MIILGTDPAAGPCRHARPGMASMASVHCTLIELYVSVKHAFPGICYQYPIKFVNIYCALDNVFVQLCLVMNHVHGV